MNVRWCPREVESPSDIAALAQKYTSAARAFVVYARGTIVFSDTSSPRKDPDYHATLLEAVRSKPDFTVQEMNDGNFLVRFKGPVTGIVMASFYDAHIDEIRSSVAEGGLLEGERVVAGTDAPIPSEHYYIGLYCRSKLFADANAPQIVERFPPA